MTESIITAIGSCAVFALPCVVVAADRQAWKNSIKQLLANWKPIKFADEVPTRTARKWGRHAH